MSVEKTIKEATKEGRLLLGSRRVLKLAKKGAIKSAICASNCLESTRRDLEYYKKTAKLEVMDFEGSSAELGGLCGKPFKIAVLGIKK